MDHEKALRNAVKLAASGKCTTCKQPISKEASVGMLATPKTNVQDAKNSLQRLRNMSATTEARVLELKGQLCPLQQELRENMKAQHKQEVLRVLTSEATSLAISILPR